METWKIILIIIVILIILLPILIAVNGFNLFNKLSKEGACFEVDSQGVKGCTMFVTKKKCKGTHFDTWEECEKHMKKQ